MGRPRNNPEDPKWQTQPVLLVCVESFTIRADGADHTFYGPNNNSPQGQTRIMSNHPWIQNHLSMFEPAVPSRGFEVEAATAAPGEQR